MSVRMRMFDFTVDWKATQQYDCIDETHTEKIAIAHATWDVIKPQNCTKAQFDLYQFFALELLVENQRAINELIWQ